MKLKTTFLLSKYIQTVLHIAVNDFRDVTFVVKDDIGTFFSLAKFEELHRRCYVIVMAAQHGASERNLVLYIQHK